MDPQQNINPVTVESAHTEQIDFIHRVFAWMCAGLVITAVTAYFVSLNPSLVEIFVGQIYTFYAILIIEVLAVVYLVKAISKMSSTQAGVIFILFSLFNGLTFSVIFLIYEISSIGNVFIITAGTFGLMAFYGYFTKRDLTTVGNIALFGLMGLILASIVNIFARSSQTDLILAYVGVVIFVALTAYDMQKIKSLNIIGDEGTDADKKEAIMGALTLYLDFINLFLKLLRILGKRRR